MRVDVVMGEGKNRGTNGKASVAPMQTKTERIYKPHRAQGESLGTEKCGEVPLVLYTTAISFRITSQQNHQKCEQQKKNGQVPAMFPRIQRDARQHKVTRQTAATVAETSPDT